MIVSGEKEGPLIPSNKKVGLILASFNQLNMDKIICQVMGFNPSKIKYIENGYKLSKYTIANKNEFNLYSESKIVDVNKYNKHFWLIIRHEECLIEVLFKFGSINLIIFLSFLHCLSPHKHLVSTRIFLLFYTCHKS